MSKQQLKTPVALFIYNRPGTTGRVFAEIAKAKPAELLVIADGPRADRPNDAEKCFAARAIIDKVNWDCKVATNYSDVNMCSRHRVSSGLNWVFDNVDEAIILEDDCLPHPTFFKFCEELLEKYRADERIALISGDNFQFGRKRTKYYSYYFSRYTHIWGWATWRRTWKNYDVNITLWPEVRDEGKLRDWLGNDHIVRYWTKMFENAYQRKIDTWDYQWTFSCWNKNTLTILPNVNLVSNIGFNSEATHTIDPKSICANMKTEPMAFPIRHPLKVSRNTIADNFTEELIFSGYPSSLSGLIRSRLRHLLNKFRK